MAMSLKKPCILIADDTGCIRDLIKAFYLEYDFNLLEAVNGREAVELVYACMPDLILLDIQMPVMNGFEVAVCLRDDNACMAIPIVIITGLEQWEVAERISGKYDGFLSKPFKKDDLITETMQHVSRECILPAKEKRAA